VIREDVVGAEITKEQRDLIAHIREDRRHQHDGHDADDNAGDGQQRARAMRPQGVDGERAGLVHRVAPRVHGH
jgi:hypothetical protein